MNEPRASNETAKHSFRDSWSMLFQCTYISSMVVLTILSVVRPASLNSRLLSLFGRPNFWLFAPDPSTRYLQLTACWTQPSQPRATRRLCGGSPIFASYDGTLAQALDPAATRPTRNYRFVEQVFDPRTNYQVLDAIALHLMHASEQSKTAGACFLVVLHEATLVQHPEHFTNRIVWSKCK